jgi:hypothetical protein
LTGLVLGCEESVRAELLSISSCKMRFSIKERKVLEKYASNAEVNKEKEKKCENV